MKKLFAFFLFLVFLGGLAHAQRGDSATMVQLIEWKYKSAKVFNETYGITRDYWMRMVPEISGRFAFTSESGRYYGFTNTQGIKDLGAYIGSRDVVTENFRKEYPEVSRKIMNNMDGPTTRSYWQIVSSLSTVSSDYDPNKFDFRKMTLFSIPFNAEKAFEDLILSIIAEEKKLGIDLSRLYAKSIDGYPGNYYILMYPDTEEAAYYQKKKQREELRRSSAVLQEKIEQLRGMITVVRIDHLNRIKF